MKYLDPQFTDHITLPDAMKLEFILADVPEHATKLQRLSQIHIKQQVATALRLTVLPYLCCYKYVVFFQDQTEAQSQEVKKLFEEYNKMMFLLSKQFAQWDETMRKMEEAKGIRPVE
ncbi:hypothetical protein GOODEAATRI_031019 [Goodea atripinnis]|uniref:Uncharacterized protein n=1 Tax=Goodea atripinnis TaxID=208336 RepID=A0ABV0NIG0_9TELE